MATQTVSNKKKINTNYYNKKIIKNKNVPKIPFVILADKKIRQCTRPERTGNITVRYCAPFTRIRHFV